VKHSSTERKPGMYYKPGLCQIWTAVILGGSKTWVHKRPVCSLQWHNYSKYELFQLLTRKCRSLESAQRWTQQQLLLVTPALEQTSLPGRLPTMCPPDRHNTQVCHCLD